MRRDALLIGLYVAAGIAFAIVINADPDNWPVVFFITVAAAIAVGWGTGKAGWRRLYLWILLPWVVVLIGLPFGYASLGEGDSDVYPVAYYALFVALPSMIAMLVAAGARALYERHGRGVPPTAA